MTVFKAIICAAHVSNDDDISDERRGTNHCTDPSSECSCALRRTTSQYFPGYTLILVCCHHMEQRGCMLLRASPNATMASRAAGPNRGRARRTCTGLRTTFRRPWSRFEWRYSSRTMAAAAARGGRGGSRGAQAEEGGIGSEERRASTRRWGGPCTVAPEHDGAQTDERVCTDAERAKMLGMQEGPWLHRYRMLVES